MNSLQEILDEKEQVQEEGFKVTDDKKANWVLRKIKENNEQKIKNTEIAEEEIYKIEEWLEQVNQPLDRNSDHLQSLLAEYAMKKKQDDPKFKSLKLPNGNLQFRKQQPKWSYDDKTLVTSLKQLRLDEYIKVEEKPVKKDIKKVLRVAGNKAVTENGEVVEGIEIEERGESFS